MNVHVKMSGSGTASDPYGVPLPTYQGLAWDYINLYAVVSAPGSDIPAAMAQLDSSYYTTYPNGLVALSDCPAAALQAWYALLDLNYPTQAGKYRPQVG